MILDYEGKLPKPGAKKIFGSVNQGKMPAVMEATSAKTSFDVDRDLVQRTPADPKALPVIFDLIEAAKENKVEAKDLQAWIDGSLKAAEMFGPQFVAKHQIKMMMVLQTQKSYGSVCVETAQQISKKIDPNAPVDVQLQVLAKVADVYRTNNLKKDAKTFAVDTARRLSMQAEKLPLDRQMQILTALTGFLGANDAKEDAGPYETRIEKLENQAYAEYSKGKDGLNFKTEKFDGRKGKSKRAVLVELFTGAQCPPCVAADMAFDGVEKTYGPGEVVLLQYHLHIPRPDPMSNVDTDGRFEYYADAYVGKVRGTPSILFNGKLAAPGGGDRDDAAEKYQEYRTVVNRLLETPDSVKLAASAVRTGTKIAITAKVDDVDKPGDKVRLRLVLVEDWVRFKGGNGLGYHHRVVRAMPGGGAKGTAVTKQSLEHKASVDLDELRGTLNKYLNEEYPDGPRPMRLRNLSVVAFVQDDATAEVLQAVNVPVRDE
jgi:hypothetical protein